MSGAMGFAFVAAGGAAGACARYAIALVLLDPASRFPYATLLANLCGALLAGFLISFLLSRGLASTPFYLLLITGFLGSFTTLSAFSVETIRMLQNGDTVLAIVNVLLTLVGALLAVLAGGWLASRIFA